jgi:hypothetical protein
MLTYGQIYKGVFGSCGLSASAATFDDMITSIALPPIFRKEVMFRLASEGRLDNPSYPLEIQHVVRHALDVASDFKMSATMINELFSKIINKELHSSRFGNVANSFFKSASDKVNESYNSNAYDAYVNHVKSCLGRHAPSDSFKFVPRVEKNDGIPQMPSESKPEKQKPALKRKPKPEITSSSCKTVVPKLVFGQMNVVKRFGASM